ncbi:MAG TPA: glycerol-3-phosphate dehydrogenase subunit GlpB [Caldilineae bacterium]|nr:glycerol-3-phosphate dehydrogenase subunit GlpB [Caldilineae bacterium]
MIDLLVIGAGLSGLMAAYHAAKASLSVRVIAKGLGALHWDAGTIDVLAYPPDSAGVVNRPLDQLAALPPTHPYRLLDEADIHAALERFAALTAELGLPYRPAAGADDFVVSENILLPSPLGAARPVFLAPASQHAGDLGRPEPMLIVGFEGLRDFYPALIAENLGKLGYAARAAFLPFALLSERRDANTVHLAHALDDPARRRNLAVELKRLAGPGERVGLPAIVGLDEHPAALADLEQQVGAPIFEIPTLPPSVPGIRLYQALRRHLLQLGVRVEAGMEAVGFSSDGGGNIQWVETATSARPLKHRARAYLLATGGILGGGFDSDHTGRVWEVVFDLPLTVPQQRSQWFRPLFLHPDGQPVNRGGVRVNRRFQPVHPSGEPVYANLWAAGGVLAGSDPIRERSLTGIDVVTGMAAAKQIVSSQAIT